MKVYPYEKLFKLITARVKNKLTERSTDFFVLPYFIGANGIIHNFKSLFINLKSFYNVLVEVES